MRPEPKRVIIKEELVVLTGDITKAIILNQFLKEMTDEWIAYSVEKLREDLLLTCSEVTLRRHIKALIKDGFLEERGNPRNKMDQTRQYRVKLQRVVEDLIDFGYLKIKK